MTAALRAADCDAYGIDLSGSAIKEATAAFGPWYSIVNESGLSAQIPFQPDLIIALEIIEHVKDPAALLADMKRAVSPSGSLLVSTPNRTICSHDALWQTDPPPVHLTWFSEEGMVALAAQVGLDAEFVNFAKFNAFTYRNRKREQTGIVKEPFLDAELQVINPVNERREAMLSRRIAPMLALAMRKVNGRTTDKSRSGSMVVRMHRRDRPKFPS